MIILNESLQPVGRSEVIAFAFRDHLLPLLETTALSPPLLGKDKRNEKIPPLFAVPKEIYRGDFFREKY